MSSHNEPVEPTPFQVEPTPFDVAQPEPAPAMSPGDPRHDGPRPWVLPALGGLVLLAALVVFWLPERIDPTAEPVAPGPETAGQDAQRAVQPAPTVAGKTDTTPWSEAQLAKLRKEAQDVLAELLDIQFALEEHGVKEWAPEPFSAAAAMATAGDELYRTREYIEAKARYEEGLAALQVLQAAMPEELARQLALAGEALETGDLARANSALDLAEAIEPGNPQAASLRRRVEVLPQLLTLLEQAASAEQGNDLAAAIELLKQAVALDPQHRGSDAELQRVTAAYQEQRFNQAMSDGYAALDANQFDTARKAFRRATQIQAGSSEAASALQEVEAAATAHRLAALQAGGLKYEQQEQWQQAVSAYKQAREIDANVLYAREGLARSEGRARLDKQFRTAIDEPLRLSDIAVAEATEQLLQQAQKISPRGPVLAEQISRLQVLLKQANTPVAVTLRSDGETEVIVYKVARLGHFAERELSLRPGNYTAVGSRNGFRDVRVEFTVNHDKTPAPLTIACTEAI